MKSISPTNAIGWLRVGLSLALMIFAMVKLWGEWNTQYAVSIMAVWALGNEMLGLAQAKSTADNKDMINLEKRVDQVEDHPQI